MARFPNHEYNPDRPGLKLSLPPERASERRRELRINFRSLEDWNEALEKGNKNRVGKDLSLEDWNGILPLLERRDDNGDVDNQALEDREEAYAILEGVKEPTPCRDYSGQYETLFRLIARDEERDRLLGGMQRDFRRGWEFIRALVFEGLRYYDRETMPEHDKKDRAYWLQMELNENGRWVVESAKCLNDFSRHRLREILRQIEDRGWRDVIWVGKPGVSPPFFYTKTTLANAESIRWRG